MNERQATKVIFLGDTAVGKTSIINKQLENFSDPLPTLNTSSVFITVNEQPLELFDTAGQERFRSLTRSYYKSAQIAILVCDVTNHLSFETLKTFYNELRNINDSAKVVMVGNKIDLKDHTVSDEEISNYANALDCSYFLTSATQNKNIKDLFQYVSELSNQCYSPELKNTVDISKSDDQDNKSSCC